MSCTATMLIAGKKNSYGSLFVYIYIYIYIYAYHMSLALFPLTKLPPAKLNLETGECRQF